MCFLPCALLIAVWHCRGSGVRPGHAFKLLLQPSTPQAAIIAINTVSPLQGFTGFQKQYREDELSKTDVCKSTVVLQSCFFIFSSEQLMKGSCHVTVTSVTLAIYSVKFNYFLQAIHCISKIIGQQFPLSLTLTQIHCGSDWIVGCG